MMLFGYCQRIILKIHKLELGFFNVNCYILQTQRFSCLIDPGADFGIIQDFILKNNIKIDFILNTHGHYDHIGAVNAVVDQFDVPFYVHKQDEQLLSDPMSNLSSVFGDKDYIVEKYELIEEDNNLFGLDIETLHLPGHTPGSILIKYKDVLFSGDVLFKGSIGRTDLVLGSALKMAKSLQRFKDIHGVCKVYPGHGPETKLDFEIKNNYYLKDIFNN
jgi:hydroxyacylglutathione hydrolase